MTIQPKDISAKTIIHMEVTSLKEGLPLGNVKKIILDKHKKTLSAIVISTKGFYKTTKVIPFSRVNAIGNNAIVVEERKNMQILANLPQMVDEIHSPFNPIGLEVITDKGDLIGVLQEYYINRNNGEITRLEITSNKKTNLYNGKTIVSAEHLLTFGKNIVISHNALKDMTFYENKSKGILDSIQSTFKELNKISFTSLSTKKENSPLEEPQKENSQENSHKKNIFS